MSAVAVSQTGRRPVVPGELRFTIYPRESAVNWQAWGQGGERYYHLIDQAKVKWQSPGATRRVADRSLETLRKHGPKKG